MNRWAVFGGVRLREHRGELFVKQVGFSFRVLNNIVVVIQVSSIVAMCNDVIPGREKRKRLFKKDGPRNFERLNCFI